MMRQNGFQILRAAWLPWTVLATMALTTTNLAQVAWGEKSPPSVFGEVIDVRVVNLEAVVTDQGKRVTGLGPRDFILTVDGKPVPVDYFTEVRGSVAVSHDDRGDQAMVPALDAGKPVGTRYLLFIDEFFSLKPRRDLVLRQILGQVANLQTQDHMAIVAYNGNKLDVLTNWTSSTAELKQVLETAMTRPDRGMAQRAEERLFLGW